MADSNIKDTVVYQLGELSGKVKSLQKGLKGLFKRVDDGFARQRQESEEAVQRIDQKIDDRFEKLDDKIDSRFLWMFGVVAIPLNLALLGFLAHLLGWV